MGKTRVVTSRDGQRTVLTSDRRRTTTVLLYAIAAVVIVAVIVFAMMSGLSNDSAGVSPPLAVQPTPVGVVDK